MSPARSFTQLRWRRADECARVVRRSVSAHSRAGGIQLWVPASPGTARLNLRSRNLLLDIAQLVLAEENLVADKESGAAERAARDRRLGVLQETLLDLGLLRARDQPCAVESGLLQRRGGDVRIVHLF